MKERWIECAKKADFEAWGKALSVSPVTARAVRNRGIETLEEAKKFLYGTLPDLPDPALYAEFQGTAKRIGNAIRAGKKIAIASDYDADGIFSGEILLEAIQEAGGSATVLYPFRHGEGYGLNERIVDEAKDSGAELLVTTDNGIAAFSAVRYAKEQGFEVVVTDHHEPQYEERDGQRKFIYPEADHILDLKCENATYPYRELCGAGVAFRLAELLFRDFGVEPGKLTKLLEYCAIATVADVVELQGDNRILVREGLKSLRRTTNPALLALLEEIGLEKENLTAHHLGFMIAPCFNAAGRLADVSIAYDLLSATEPQKIRDRAAELRALNEVRKEMTEEGVREAEAYLEKAGTESGPVLVVPLENTDESVVGIIAGRLKENYYRPVFVLSVDRESGIAKGSGRSIPGYSLADALIGVKDLLLRFGGHALAAGVSLKIENIDAFRDELNEKSTLTEADLERKILFDARLPLAYVTPRLVRELDLLAPFGTGNSEVLFARPDFRIDSLRKIGKEGRFLRLEVHDGTAGTTALVFREPERVLEEIRQGYGEDVLQDLLRGQRVPVLLAFTYYPVVNEFRGNVSTEIICQNCCRLS